MKTFVVTLATILLLAAFSGIVIAQEMEQEKEEQPMQMPMMQGMMGGQGGMQGGMMQGGMMGGQGGMMQGGMMCPMCGQMMKGGMMQGMMGGGMMDQMHKMPTPQMLLSLTDELKLDEEQIKSIQKIGFDLQKEVIRKNADRSIAGVELNALLCQDEIDLGQAQQKIQQIATLMGELRIAQIKASIEAKKVLTEEQQEKMKELMMKKPAMHTPKKAATPKGKKAEKGPMH